MLRGARDPMRGRVVTSNEIGRGVLIVFVFYVHSLYALTGSTPDAQRFALAWFQLKVLAPQVAIFFLLAGMTSHSIAGRPLRVILARSLMLLLLAVVSHLVGAVLETLLYPGHFPWAGLPRRLAGPILYGTGYSTFVAWFFIVLAITRLLAWCFHHDRRIFLAGAVGIAAVGLGASRLGLPDNLFEWRNLPVAVTLFLLGMRIGSDRPVPHWAALAGLAGAMAIGLLVSPRLLEQGLCLRCDLTFVAQPMVGGYGVLPAYLLQLAGGSLALLGAAQWLCGTGLGRMAGFFGRSSLMFLLLHGWVITAFYPAATLVLPREENLLLYPAIMVFNLVLHAALFVPLRPLLAGTIALCGRIARGLPGMARASTSGRIP